MLKSDSDETEYTVDVLSDIVAMNEKKEKIESKQGFTPGISSKNRKKGLVLDECIFKISIRSVTNGHATIAFFAEYAKRKISD